MRNFLRKRGLGFERLEDKRALTATAGFSNGTLSIVLMTFCMVATEMI